MSRFPYRLVPKLPPKKIGGEYDLDLMFIGSFISHFD